MGRYSEWTENWEPTQILDQPTLDRRLAQRFDEVSFAADLRIESGAWKFQTEFALNDREYDDEGRPLVEVSLTRLAPDMRRFGGYAMVGHRFHWFSLMPYMLFDYMHRPPGSISTVPGPMRDGFGLFTGINIRPSGSLVLKLELLRTFVINAPKDSWGREPFHSMQLQAAWVF